MDLENSHRRTEIGRLGKHRVAELLFHHAVELEEPLRQLFGANHDKRQDRKPLLDE